MKNPQIDINGTKRWFNEKGLLHREDDHAVEWIDGYKVWYINGEVLTKENSTKKYSRKSLMLYEI